MLITLTDLDRMLCSINTNYVRIFHCMDSFVFVDASLRKWVGGAHTSLLRYSEFYNTHCEHQINLDLASL